MVICLSLPVVAGKATLASEALAGLASKESFDKTKLRKAESFSGLSPSADKYLPYKDLMLLQIKGERVDCYRTHCTCTLPERVGVTYLYL